MKRASFTQSRSSGYCGRTRLAKAGALARDHSVSKGTPDGVRGQRAAGLFSRAGVPQEGAQSGLSSTGEGFAQASENGPWSGVASGILH